MKKGLFLLSAIVLLSVVIPTASAEEAEPTIKKYLLETKDDLSYYAPLSLNGDTINLYPETKLTKNQAIKKFSKAYKFIEDDLTDRGVAVDFDSGEFQDLVKTYFLIELDDKILEKEIHDFAAFMDFYENKAINDKIVSTISNSVSSRSVATEDVIADISALLPSSTSSTLEVEPSNGQQPEITPFFYESNYAATYAKNWWNKTNNTLYPYYAEYYGQSTTNNNINDLPSGSTGQSNPRRAWNDCTNFVSQALQNGGLATIKKGILNPAGDSDNWYYSDSKPSHTWGGAHNFYQHFSKRAGVASTSSVLGIGDAVSIDFTGDGSIDHTVIITKTTGTATNQQYVTYHTYDTNQTKTLSDFYTGSAKVYGYEIDKIQ
ncbi:amidase domain-containing protein [Paenibacillus lentus]|uniref:Putative amidase domain-containing protein n=1 Tax=Paenibacillus lentus TaxID=1338368 RepID=A0A3Q8SAI2_9BACL|nr:amidase domain-containing protein [Paenibacillus lentus]AZK46077.1 hypothetical protein EIM92_07615 [Paenibacillus lentus]